MNQEPSWDETYDVVVAGSGAAALSAALTSAVGGASVLVVEKSERFGGTSAMSGAGVWVPANHLAQESGLADSPDEAFTYLKATAPEGWAEQEEHLWRRYVDASPEMLRMLDEKTPLQFELTPEPDPMAEYEGGKDGGRMVSPRALSRQILGSFGDSIRESSMPNLFTYREVQVYGPFKHPIRAAFRLAHRLAFRLLSKSRGQGNALVTGLMKGCMDAGCVVWLQSKVTELVTDDVGVVTGIVSERSTGVKRVRARRGVVLATGGFEWDEARREAHFSGHVDRIGSPRTNTGDGHKLAESVGASLERMDQANIYATLPVHYEGDVHGIPALFHNAAHAIVVDQDAKRFASEFDYNFGEHLDARNPSTGQPVHLPSWMIADSNFLAASGMFRWYARKLPGFIRKANTIRQLAELIELDPEVLEATVGRYNEHAQGGRDLDFHRGETAWERFKSGATRENLAPALGTVAKAPFIAVPVNRSILVTKGGPRTNENGEVLRKDGSVIGGLYCAGVAMANPIGTRAVGAGTTLGPCMTWGYICGQSLLKTNR